MKIESGKYYVTRGGDVVGPMVRCENVCYAYPWVGKNDDVDVYYTESGAFFVRNSDRRDLIKEHVMPRFKVGDRVKWGGYYGNVTYVQGYVEFETDNGQIVRRPEPDIQFVHPDPAPPPLDLTKPVQTRDGRKVRVLCTDGPGSRPVIGIVDGNKGPSTWCLNGATSEGWFNPDLESESALINTPATPRTFERWFNVYDTGEITSHVDRHDADGEIPWQTRIARKRVIFTEGEWDE